LCLIILPLEFPLFGLSKHETKQKTNSFAKFRLFGETVKQAKFLLMRQKETKLRKTSQLFVWFRVSSSVADPSDFGPDPDPTFGNV
jgi:hypothetical protein